MLLFLPQFTCLYPLTIKPMIHNVILEMTSKSHRQGLDQPSAYQAVHTAHGWGFSLYYVWITVSWEDLRCPSAGSYTASFLLYPTPPPINGQGVLVLRPMSVFSKIQKVGPDVFICRLGKRHSVNAATMTFTLTDFCIQAHFKLCG